MTDKQRIAYDTILAALPETIRGVYREVADCAVELGYMPTLRGAKLPYADFSKSKVGRTLLKIDSNPRFEYQMSMKFYALPGYDGVFGRAIEARFATWKRLGYQTVCFACGHCDGDEGYIVDDRFLCGNGLLPLPHFSQKDLDAVKQAMRIQDDYYITRHGRKKI